MVVKNLPDQEQEAISEQEKRDQEAREQATGNMDISVMRMYRFETDRPLKAFVDITINDVLLIKGVRVMEKKGKLEVSMPREQAKDQKWYDTIRCLTKEVADQIQEVVLEAYKAEG